MTGRGSVSAAPGLCLLLWLGAAYPVVGSAQPAAQSPVQSPVHSPELQQSRYQKTLAYLQGAAPALRGEFAAIALSELAAAYEAEARLAREQAREQGRGPDQGASLRSWSMAVDGYARQMPLVLEDIELGFPVSLIPGSGTAPAVSVADRVVMLSHPRPSQQQVFEREILGAFCARHRCEYYQSQEPAFEPEPIEIYTGSVRPTWSFTQRGPSCSYRGITVRFSGDLDLSNSRVICEQLMREVKVLADEFSWQHRHAVSIDWDGLVIKPTQGGPEHVVRLNGVGDVLLVSIPLLYSTPGLLQQVSPWIRQRLGEEQELDVELEARDFGWQEP